MLKWLRRIALGVLGLVVIALAVTVRLDLPAADVDAKYSSPASKFLDLASGARVHVRDEGKRDGPALVLVHGSNDSLHTWEAWVPLLGRDFRLVSLDLPGHGLTGRVPGDDYSNDALVRCLAAVVDVLGLRDFALAGNSLGGHVAWRYALDHQDRVQRLILLDAGGYPNAGPRPTFAKVLALPGAQLFIRYLDPAPLVRSGFRQAVVDPNVITPQSIERSVEMIRREGSRDAIAHRLKVAQMVGPYARMRELRMPTLILWGERDRFVPVQNAYRFKADIRNSSLITYPNVGHLPMREVPERSAAHVREFMLKELPTEPSTAAAQNQAPQPAPTP
ncbi:MAG: alpha/beta fold hydrolase [Polyangiales bacterium]